MYTLSGIYIYPVKSLGAVSLESAEPGMRGLKYDRRWALIDETNNAITQRECRQMTLVSVAIHRDHMILSHKEGKASPIQIPLIPEQGNSLTIHLFKDDCMAWHINSSWDEWLSKTLNVDCRLVYMPEESKRQINPIYADEGEYVSLADGYPYLLTSEESLLELNSHIDTSEQVPMDRFRPNLVVKGVNPYEEDNWAEIKVGNAIFNVAKPCRRCVLTTINQDTAEKGIEPLIALNNTRRREKGVEFGQNLLYRSGNTLTIGDDIRILAQKGS